MPRRDDVYAIGDVYAIEDVYAIDDAYAKEEVYAILLGLAPTALVATLFIIVPLAFSLYLSLWDWPLLGHQPQFVGLGNWIRLLGDREFWAALRVTALYALGSVPTGYGTSCDSQYA